ncbi:MAG: preprotein translocase subunit SecG [Opitutaceae bacterium]|jgi:preprotein translocase subunit SecG|nr:preprotein translocase subunit SecG [Opitutaceae bacterium]
MSILTGIFTLILVLVSAFLILIVLMQKSKSDAGAAVLGGGATEAAFGADTGNILFRGTVKAAIAFFVLSFGLYLANIHIADTARKAPAAGLLPTVTAPADTAAPAAPAAAPAPAPAPANP